VSDTASLFAGVLILGGLGCICYGIANFARDRTGRQTFVEVFFVAVWAVLWINAALCLIIGLGRLWAGV
jgi:hypothetical protein